MLLKTDYTLFRNHGGVKIEHNIPADRVKEIKKWIRFKMFKRKKATFKHIDNEYVPLPTVIKMKPVMPLYKRIILSISSYAKEIVRGKKDKENK